MSKTNTARSAFHARHSAIAKTYEYRILRAAASSLFICPPFVARYVYACPWPLSLKALQAAARLFIGEHDFLSFAATDPDLARRSSDQPANLVPANLVQDQKKTVRKIFSSTWEQRSTESGELLIYRIRGNAFLHHMVRNLVGTMIDVGRGHLALEEIPRILAARCRSEAGPTAPARGLFLHSVDYPPEPSLEA